MATLSKILLSFVLLAIVVGGAFFWLWPSHDAGHMAPASAEPVTRIGDAGAPAPAPSATSSDVPWSEDGAVRPARKIAPVGARQLFANTNLTLGDRFRGLVDLAFAGDETAAHLAVQIANQCNAASQAPVDQSPVGHEHATQYQIRVHRQTQADCAAVLAAPEFDDLQTMAQAHPVDALDASVKDTIRHRFADQGADAALDAAVSAIMARPDETTAMVVADQLADLDISSVYMQPQLQSVSSVNPQQRNMLMRYALGLLACDYGRPCGPDSFAVRSTCFALGACVPGADLQMVYEQQLLTGQQVQDVRALLAYLRKVNGTMVHRWR
ncbi:MAG TPA: hypothetical protein VFG73_10825 [Rhodanobacteraceae bacterium]|nr:hypothetical protein [Rhodanobacteraceae bacterium]